MSERYLVVAARVRQELGDLESVVVRAERALTKLDNVQRIRISTSIQRP